MCTGWSVFCWGLVAGWVAGGVHDYWQLALDLIADHRLDWLLDGQREFSHAFRQVTGVRYNGACNLAEMLLCCEIHRSLFFSFRAVSAHCIAAPKDYLRAIQWAVGKFLWSSISERSIACAVVW